MIKDNHLAVVGGDITEAMRLARESSPELKIEVEANFFSSLADRLIHLVGALSTAEFGFEIFPSGQSGWWNIRVQLKRTPANLKLIIFIPA